MKSKLLCTYLLYAFGITWFFEIILIILDKSNLLGQNVVLFSVLMALGIVGPGAGTFFAWKKEGKIKTTKEFFPLH